MSEHEIRAVPTFKYGGSCYRWKCSCGKIGKGRHGYKGQAEQAGLDHAKAKLGAS